MFRDLIPLFDVSQANILMSNHVPPRACLADFGFTTMVFDPAQPMSCSAQLEGGTMVFMSPELLVPKNFGMDNALPTPEADIYAFGLVIFQVCEQGWRYCDFSYFVQVLTGEFPFRGIGLMQLGWSLLQGLRPDKPEDASSIGFSDSLWGFVQRCWDGDMKSRPKVAEVVTHLEGAAADWKGLMPPYVRVVNVVSGPKEEGSDTMKFREFEIFILLWFAHRTTVQVGSFRRLRVATRSVPSNHEPPLGYSAPEQHLPSTLNRHRKNPDLGRSLLNLPRSHSLMRSRTTIFTERPTRTSTRTTNLPHPRFPRRNGKVSNASSRCSANSLVLFKR